MPSSGQTISARYYAWNTSTGAPVTGDSGNHTLFRVDNGTKGSALSSPTIVELGGGWYNTSITTTAGTTVTFSIYGTSSTSNVVIAGLEYDFEQLPIAAPNAAGGLLTYGTGTGQLNPTSGLFGTPQTGDAYLLLHQANTELTNGSLPTVTSNLVAMIQYLFTAAKNKHVTSSAGGDILYKSDGSTVLSTSSIAFDGTTFTRGAAA